MRYATEIAILNAYPGQHERVRVILREPARTRRRKSTEPDLEPAV